MPDAFLNGLVTNDMAKVAPATRASLHCSRHKGRSSSTSSSPKRRPNDGGGFFLDCPRALASALVEKLNFYKLRAKVICEDLSEVLGVMAIWDGAGGTEYGLSYPDPRLSKLGSRVMLPPHLAEEAAADLGASLVGCGRLRNPPHCARRATGRSRFHVCRHIPARGRHGPAQRRRFRQRLLRRTGGCLARRAPRQRAQPRRADCL